MEPFPVVSLKSQYVTTGARSPTAIMLRLSAGITRRLSFEDIMTLMSNVALDMLGKRRSICES